MKAQLKKTIEHKVEIDISGEEIADLFWSLCEREQSEFFNRLGQKNRFVSQLHAVTDADCLSYEGRNAMARIGEYSYKSKS